MAFPYEEATAYAHAYKRPVMVDNIYKSNVMFKRMKEQNRIEIDGGTQIEQATEFAKANGGNFDGAYDTVSTQHKKIADYAVLQWKFKYAYADITLKDRVRVRGKAKVISLVDHRFKSMEKKLTDLMGDGFYSAGTDSTEMDGMRHAIDTGNTYAGIAQGTYTWWAAAGEDTTTTTLSLAALQTAYGNTYDASGENPTIVITDQAEFNKYWTLVQPQQRFEQSQAGDQAKVGFTSLLFNGKPFVSDNKCPDGHLWMFNENHIKLWISDEANFDFTGWQKPINQPGASIGYTLFAGNFLVDAPRSNYKFTALDD